jgi:hypothetical protein
MVRSRHKIKINHFRLTLLRMLLKGLRQGFISRELGRIVMGFSDV